MLWLSLASNRTLSDVPGLLNLSVLSFSVVTSQSGWHQCQSLMPKESMTKLHMKNYVTCMFCTGAVQPKKNAHGSQAYAGSPYYMSNDSSSLMKA